MFNQDTGLWRDGNLPQGYAIVDGYGKAKELSNWEKDLVDAEINNPLLDEELLEDQF